MTTENPGMAAAAPEGTAARDTASERVAAVLRALVKLIHARRLYAANNPRLAQFRREFAEVLERCFRDQDVLVLSVEPSTIRWNDVVVYENDRREESLAWLLHRDGVGELTIGVGAMGREIDLLVDILADEFYRRSEGDDVVTRFWNADFEHVSYRVLDDYLAAPDASVLEPGDDAPTVADHDELLPSLADRGRRIVHPTDPIESIDEYLRRIIMRTCRVENEEEREQYFQSMVGSFFTISNEEMASYQEQARREAESDGLADFLESIIVFTLLPGNATAVRDVCGVVERVVDFVAAEERPDALARTLECVRAFRASHDLPDAIDALCARLEGRLVERELVDELAARMMRGEAPVDETLAYLRVAGAGAADAMLRVLHHTEDRRLHRALCDALADVTGGDLETVIDRLDIDNPVVAGDAVYLARRMDPPRITARVRELANYPDRAVREAIVALARDAGGDDALAIVLGAMDDPDKHVRCRAVEAAAVSGDARARRRVVERAFGRDLGERDADEREVVFRALGRCGDADTVERLRRFVDRRGFLGLGRNRENRFLAIRALENIHRPESLSLLQQLAEDSNELVASRASRAAEAVAAALAQRTAAPLDEDDA